MIRMLLSYYFLDKFMPNTNKTPSKMVCCFITMAILAMLAATSIVVGECGLAYLGFKYLTDTLQHTEKCSWIIVTGAFFLQAILALTILARKINKANQAAPEEQSKFKAVISAFIEGFKSVD